MKYINIREAATNWNISERRIRQLVQEKRIDGATKVGGTWNIPEDASKPVDRRLRTEEDFEINISYDFFEKIDEKKKILKNRRLASNNTLKHLEKDEILKWIYNSNAIEGNTLTFYETKHILDGTAVGGKSIREHLEVINHKDAITFIKDLANKGKFLNEADIKSINKIVLRGIDNDNAGKYRTQNDNAFDEKENQAEEFKVSEQMEQLMMNYDGWCEDYYLPEIIALLYGEFLKINPFVAGNGVTARLLINLENMRNGYPPIIIKNDIKKQHNKALKKAHTTGDYTELVKIIAKEQEDSIDLYLKATE